MNSRIACMLLAAVLAVPAAAQTFPSKPVRIIVVYPPGGTSDAVMRLLAEKLAAEVVAQAKARPGSLRAGTSGIATLKLPHAEINATLAMPDVADRLTKLDNVVAPSNVEQFAQVVRREYEANAKIVAQAGSRSE